MAASKVREMFEQGTDAFNKHDIEEMARTMADDVRATASGAGEIRGKQAVRAFYESWIDAFPDARFPAQVLEVAKNANVKNPGTEAEVTTFPVRLALTGPAPGALPGMSCEATISTETHQDAVVVPIQAVTVRADRDLSEQRSGPTAPPTAPDTRRGDVPARRRRDPVRKIVFVVEGGLAKARPVETGLADESSIEIVSGLAEGERIVEGPYRALSRELRPGRPVVPEAGDAKGRSP